MSLVPSRAGRIVGLVALAVVLVACSNDAYSETVHGNAPSGVYVEKLADGQVASLHLADVLGGGAGGHKVQLVVITPGSTGDRTVVNVEPEEAPELSHDTEGCAADGQTCFRIGDSERIDMSVDGGSSWSTVWRIDRDSIIVARAAGFGSKWDGSADIYDLAVADDGVMAFQMEYQWDPIWRLTDGTWSVDDIEFRRIPGAFYGLVATLALIGLAAWNAGLATAGHTEVAGARLRRSIAASAIVALISARFAVPGGLGWQITMWASIGVLAVTTLIVADRIDELRIVDRGRTAWLASAGTVALVAAAPIRVSWYEHNALPFTWARDIGIVAALVGAALLWSIARKLADDRRPRLEPATSAPG